MARVCVFVVHSQSVEVLNRVRHWLISYIKLYYIKLYYPKLSYTKLSVITMQRPRLEWFCAFNTTAVIALLASG